MYFTYIQHLVINLRHNSLVPWVYVYAPHPLTYPRILAPIPLVHQRWGGGGGGGRQGNLIEGQPYRSFLRRRGVYFCRRKTEEREEESARFSFLPSSPARFLFSWYCDTQPEHLQRREISQRIRVPFIVHAFRLRPDAGCWTTTFFFNQRYIWPLVYSHSYVTHFLQLRRPSRLIYSAPARVRS